MSKVSLGSILIALAICFSNTSAAAVEYGQTAQEFQRAATVAPVKPARKRVAHQVPVQRLPTINVLGGSWLESNLGASRPHGAPGPWCGYAMRLEVMSMGRADPGPAYNAVSSWHNYGTPAPRAAVGSLFISRGHISKVVAGDCPPGRVRTISGNAAGARVSYMCEPLSSLVVSRWP